MKSARKVTLALMLALLVAGVGAQAVTTITYWQYFYESKVNLVDELIKKFEATNPGIKVEQVTFPYESFNQKVAASIPAGEGPDVITLFYGWLPMYVKAGYLQELPKTDFNKAYFDKTYYPFVAESVDFGGKYYSAPTAVRTLALIWNKKLFKEAGLDPNVPPKTLEELAAYAKKLSKYDNQGNLIQAGLAMQPTWSWVTALLSAGPATAVSTVSCTRAAAAPAGSAATSPTSTVTPPYAPSITRPIPNIFSPPFGMRAPDGRDCGKWPLIDTAPAIPFAGGRACFFASCQRCFRQFKKHKWRTYGHKSTVENPRPLARLRRTVRVAGAQRLGG